MAKIGHFVILPNLIPALGLVVAIFRQLSWFFYQQRRRYGLSLLALLIIAFVSMLPPWITGRVVDAMAEGQLTSGLLYRYLGILLLAALVSYGLRVLWRITLFGASFQLGHQLRLQIYQRLTQQSASFYQQFNTGDLMARATNDVQAVEMAAGEAVLAMFDGLLTALMVLLIMTLFISWPLTLVALLPWPIVGYFMWRFGQQLHDSFNLAQQKFSELNERTQESLAAMRLTKAYGREQVEWQSFAQVAKEANQANQQVAAVDAKYDPAISLAIAASFLLAIMLGAYLIEQQQLTLGKLTSFTLYLGYMVWPMFAVGWLLNLLERANAAYARIEQLLNSPISIRPGEQDLANPNPSLELAITEFRYRPELEPALLQLQHQLPAGQLLGMVGPIGSGKSTLVQLLTRQLQSDSANICLAEQPLAELSEAALAQLMAVVPQDAFLFSLSIAENIALGRPDASQAEIEAVAMVAQVHQDILAMPEAYQTQVGERGVTLSGGQKQRIAIARALLQQAPILILDDALSAVDVQTEAQILRHLRQQRQGKTTIICCHRLTAVEQADHILVLDHGQVVQQGRHQQLLQQPGWYQQIHQYQQLQLLVEQGK